MKMLYGLLLVVLSATSASAFGGRCIFGRCFRGAAPAQYAPASAKIKAKVVVVKPPAKQESTQSAVEKLALSLGCAIEQTPEYVRVVAPKGKVFVRSIGSDAPTDEIVVLDKGVDRKGSWAFLLGLLRDGTHLVEHRPPAPVDDPAPPVENIPVEKKPLDLKSLIPYLPF